MKLIPPENNPQLIERVELKPPFLCETGASLGALLVTDKCFTTWEIPFNLLPVEPEEYFELDPDGSFIYWPKGDIHMDMIGLRALVDKELALKFRKEKEEYEREHKEAIFLVANKFNVILPPLPLEIKLDTLRSLAVLHGLSTNKYLNELAKVLPKQGDKYESNDCLASS